MVEEPASGRPPRCGIAASIPPQGDNSAAHLRNGIRGALGRSQFRRRRPIRRHGRESLGDVSHEARLVRRFILEGKTQGAHGRQVALRERTSFDEDGVVLSADGRGDPQFLHAVLCQLGLPRNPTPSKTFERRSGRAHLSLQAGRTFDGMKFVDQPLPSGTRPRLVLINLCSEVRAHARPEREHWRQRAGVPAAAQHRSRRREHGAVPQADAGAELLPHDARR